MPHHAMHALQIQQYRGGSLQPEPWSLGLRLQNLRSEGGQESCFGGFKRSRLGVAGGCGGVFRGGGGGNEVGMGVPLIQPISLPQLSTSQGSASAPVT